MEREIKFRGKRTDNGEWTYGNLFVGENKKTYISGENLSPVEVRYEEIYASFGLWRKGFSFLHSFHEYVEPGDCEVIGNIHDKEQINDKAEEKYINRLYELKRFIQNGINLTKQSADKECSVLEVVRLKEQLGILEKMLASIDKFIDKYKTE